MHKFSTISNYISLRKIFALNITHCNVKLLNIYISLGIIYGKLLKEFQYKITLFRTFILKIHILMTDFIITGMSGIDWSVRIRINILHAQMHSNILYDILHYPK